MPNYRAFQKALNQIAADRTNASKAYQKIPGINTVTKPMQQYMFLRDYNKLNQSQFTPITENPKSNLRKQELIGLNYDHDGITEEIDFRKPENAKYKEIFEQSYLKMTLYPRTQSRYGDLSITKGISEMGPKGIRTNNDVYTIHMHNGTRTEERDDPLSALNTDDADFINYVIDDIRRKTKNKKIVLDTDRILLTKDNEETDGIDIYTTTADIKADDETKWKHAKKVLSVTQENAKDIPFDAIYSLPESVWHPKDRRSGRHPDYIREIDLRPAKNGTGDIDIYIQDDGMPPTKKELEEMARQQETRKKETYDLLARYSRYGADKNVAADIIRDYEFKTFGHDTNDIHEKMLGCMSKMLIDMMKTGKQAIRQSIKEQNLSPYNTDAITAGYMSATDGLLEYFPIYDKSDGQTTWHVPIAIAAMHKYDKAQTLYGILRLDDPGAKAIYDEMKAYAKDATGTADVRKTVPDKTAAHKQETAISRKKAPTHEQEQTAVKDDVPIPVPADVNVLLSKFKASLTDFQRENPHAIDKAYRKAASTCAPIYEDQQQHKFLKELAKLVDSPFEPIETRGKNNTVNMSGIRFTRRNAMGETETYDIDFTKDEYKPVKKAFDNAFLEMTLNERTNGDFRQIRQDMDYNGNITIRASGIDGYSYDPLGRKTAKLTARLIQKTPTYSNGLNITIETKKTLLIRRDLESNGYVIYASDAEPDDPEKDKWEQAYPIMRAGSDGMPPAGLNIAAIKYKGSVTYGNGQQEPITEIRFGHNGLQVTKARNNTKTTQQKPASVAQKRSEAFAFMTKYATTARTEREGNIMLKSIGLEPDANRDALLKGLHAMESQIMQMSGRDIHDTASRNRIASNSPKYAGQVIGSVMRRQIDDTVYYPMYDRTKDARETNSFIGIAAVNPANYDIKGILRTDDPETKRVFDNVTRHVRESLGFGPTAKTQQPTTTAAIDKKKSQLYVNYNSDENTCRIASRSGVKTTGDPLSKKYIDATLSIVKDMHETHPGVNITVDSDYLINISKNGRNNDIYAYYMNQKASVEENHKIMTITPKTDAAKLFSVKTQRSFYYGNTSTDINTKCDLAKCAGEMINSKYVTKVQEKAIEMTCMAATNPLHMDIMSMRRKSKIDGLKPISCPQRTIPESQKPDFMREENMGADNGLGYDTYG